MKGPQHTFDKINKKETIKGLVITHIKSKSKMSLKFNFVLTDQ